MYLHDVIGSVNVIVSMKPGRHVDLPLSHATLSIPLVDHAYYRLPYHEPLEHFDRSMIGHSILSIRRLEFPHIENSICEFNCPIWEAKKRTIWEEILTLLPGLMWPSCSAIEPRLTFSTMAPKRLFDNNWPPITFKPNLSSESRFFLKIIWPIIRVPSADTCQLTGFGCFDYGGIVFCDCGGWLLLVVVVVVVITRLIVNFIIH